MAGNSNPLIFVSLLLLALVRNFHSVNSEETTATPIDVVDVSEVAESTSSVSTTPEAYDCKNSFNIQSLQEFKEKVLNSTSPIMVQFHAPWSEPCSILTPRIARAIDDKGGKIKLARVDIDKHEKIGLEVGIQIVPCIAAFRAGELIEKLTGIQEESNLKIFIGKYISN